MSDHCRGSRATRAPFALVLLPLLLLLGEPAAAGQGSWTGGGPEGGRITDVAIDPATPTTIYAAATLNGVFKSTDSGANWSAVGEPGDPAFNISGFTIGGTGTLYALACCSNEVFRSADGGQTWAGSSSGLEGSSRRPGAIRVDPGTASTVYVGTTGEGVFKSVDSGVTWNASNTGIADKNVTTIAIDPSAPSTLYAGTLSDGVFKSTDSGGSWVAVNTGLTTLRIERLLVDPATPLTLYAGTDDDGVFKSSDGGASWVAANTGMPAGAEILSLGLDPATPSTLFAGLFGQLFRSTDSGANWSEVAAGVSGVRLNGIQAVSSSTTKVYLATNGGVVKSSDGGSTWTESNAGLQAFLTEQILPVPPATTTAYAVSNAAGIYKSTDAGVTWQAANQGLPTRSIQGQGRGVSLSSGNPQTLYASVETDVARTTDGGATWSPRLADPSDFGPFGPFILPLAAHPTDPNTVFASNLASFICCGLSIPVILKSTDGGANWSAGFEVVEPVSFHQSTEIIVDPVDPNRIYAGALVWLTDGSRGFHVLRSTNGGTSFEEVLAEFSGSFVFPYLAIDPSEPATVYAAVRRPVPTIHRTLNGGDTWTALTPSILPDSSVFDIETHPVVAGRVYLAVGTSLFVSQDRGGTWAEFDLMGLPAHNGVRSIGVSPTGSTTIYAGTTGGVYSYTSSCGFSENLDLSSQTVDDTRSFIACETIFAGSGFNVVSPGQVALEAGIRIVLRDGFSVEDGGGLTMLIKPF